MTGLKAYIKKYTCDYCLLCIELGNDVLTISIIDLQTHLKQNINSNNINKTHVLVHTLHHSLHAVM